MSVEIHCRRCGVVTKDQQVHGAVVCPVCGGGDKEVSFVLQSSGSKPEADGVPVLREHETVKRRRGAR